MALKPLQTGIPIDQSQITLTLVTLAPKMRREGRDEFHATREIQGELVPLYTADVLVSVTNPDGQPTMGTIAVTIPVSGPLPSIAPFSNVYIRDLRCGSWMQVNDRGASGGTFYSGTAIEPARPGAPAPAPKPKEAQPQSA